MGLHFKSHLAASNVVRDVRHLVYKIGTQCRSWTDARPILVKEGLALHQHVVLTEGAIEEVPDAGVVGHHEPAHAVR